MFAHNGRMQAPIQVGFWVGDKVFEAPRDRTPDTVDNTEHFIAVLHRINNYAQGDEVIDLIKAFTRQHFAIDTVKMFGTPLHLRPYIDCSEMIAEGK